MYCLKISKPTGDCLSPHGADWLHHFPAVWQRKSGLWFCSNSSLLSTSGVISYKLTIAQQFKPTKHLSEMFCEETLSEPSPSLTASFRQESFHTKCWRFSPWFGPAAKQNTFPYLPQLESKHSHSIWCYLRSSCIFTFCLGLLHNTEVFSLINYTTYWVTVIHKACCPLFSLFWNTV